MNPPQIDKAALELAARALAENYHSYKLKWDEFTCDAQALWREKARTAIAAYLSCAQTHNLTPVFEGETHKGDK